MIKILGIALISGCCAGVGILYNRALRQEQNYLEGLLRLARFIRSRIDCFSSPLDSIYADFSDEALNTCGFTEILRNDGLTAAIEAKKDTLSLSEETYDLIIRFSAELGKSFSDEQVRHCDHYIALIDEKANSAASELPKKCKTVKTLCIAAGAMAALLLI